MHHAMELSIESIQKREEPYQLFLDYFKNDETKRKYKNFLYRFLMVIPDKVYEEVEMEPPSSQQVDILASKFVQLARLNQKLAQNIIASYIKEEKKMVENNKLHTNTLPNHVKPIRALMEANELTLNWKFLYRLYPRGKIEADDRAYTRKELQRMIEASPDITDKLIIELFSAGGFRLEAWNFFIWKDVEFFKNRDGSYKGASLVVYRGDPESYTTFITPEACMTLENYKEFWKSKTGSYPSPNDPLIRSVRFPTTQRLTAVGVKRRLEKIVAKIGLRPPLQPGKRRHEVALDHGFRKYFNTMLRTAKIDYLDKEDMMGHKVGLESHYERYRDNSSRFNEYQKAIPFLTISDTERLRLQNQQLEEDKTELEKRIPELVKDAVERIKNDLITEGWKIPTSN